jgi:hypothetical protein
MITRTEDTISSPDLPSANAQKIRDLDSFEEMFWMIEQNLPIYHVLAAEVKGETEVAEWRSALARVQKRHPLLSASIRKDPGERPYFVRTHGIPVPLRIEPWSDELVLHEEMEKELNGSFGDSSGPLMRVTLFHGPERSAVLLAANHSPFDGKSSMLIFQDLLASLVGEPLGATLGVPSLSSVFGRLAPEKYSNVLSGKVVALPDGLLPNLPPTQVKRLLLDEQETETLIKRAKEEGTTVTGALIAALALAGVRYSKEWQPSAVRCLSPIDVRDRLGAPNVPGLLISCRSHSVDAASDLPFWTKAKIARESLAPGLTKEGVLETLDKLKAAVAEEHTARAFLEGVRGTSFAHDLLLTNYAGYRVRTDDGTLRLTSLFTGSPSLGQKVSVVTVNGRLGMTLVSRQPFPSLLEDAREILFQA